MTDSNQGEADAAVAEWPLRPLLLAFLGLATGLVAHLIIGKTPDSSLSAGLLSALAFVTITAGLIGFTIERRYWWASVAFALAMGAIAAAVVWWNGGPDHWSGGDGWRSVSLLLAIAIAAPLFQAARDEGRPRFPYVSVHDHAWTNVVLWGACWVFVGISFALAFLLAGLFNLIKLSFLSDLLNKEWFWRALMGTAFGGALGLLREHDGVVRLLQRVVLTVLSVLAPVLAAGLIVFLLALPFTGLAPLWEAGSATGILLACVVGSLILANSVIGNAPAEERTFPLLKYGAMGLALVMLPLGIIAAVAIGLRIGQYGFTPERLWALTFVILACAYGLAYLVSLVRGRLDWAAKVRPANLNLAFGTCALALLLATPLVSFNAIATHDQVARLETGKLTPEKFDWRALAFEFGEAGKTALRKLQASPNAAIRARAVEAGKAGSRSEIPEIRTSRSEVIKHLRVLPAGSAPLPDTLLDYLGGERCGGEGQGGCTVLIVIPGSEVALLRDNCFRAGQSWSCTSVERAKLIDGKWVNPEQHKLAHSGDEDKAKAAGQQKAYAAGQVEIRDVTRRQVFVGGEPIGPALE